jgi:hypothetical protein
LIESSSRRSDEYWDHLYRHGGNSGTTLEGKSEVLNVFEENAIPMSNVIDLGCGDMIMWEGHVFDSYFGIDASPAIINRNKTRYPNYRFEEGDISAAPFAVAAPTVTCFNVLFHVRDDEAFVRILKNMVAYSTDYIVIVTWKTNPLNDKQVRRQILRNLLRRGRIGSWLRLVFASEIQDDLLYQKYRPFEKYISIFSDGGFRLVKTIDTGAHGAFYVFRKQS